MALNAMRQAFVEAFCGNATEAALKAGYSPKTAYSQGQRLLKNDEVKAAIAERGKSASSARIATRDRHFGPRSCAIRRKRRATGSVKLGMIPTK